jgi:hypothetical protein
MLWLFIAEFEGVTWCEGWKRNTATLEGNFKFKGIVWWLILKIAGGLVRETESLEVIN